MDARKQMSGMTGGDEFLMTNVGNEKERARFRAGLVGERFSMRAEQMKYGFLIGEERV
jgi:hypothetical protein